ncbi:Aspartic proteinase yapsin-3 [Wickerhamiella sorbophila]|uniref:Aspartic proteinase yapsin-3 n=1 Tax=Wickerhamiella sorbophila TaxID=45607 RepID=A0A2T0FM66_9ASCO|nr:Aspartic proteinase yapsin-3 [Wickerhamiella sorbophila]PRT56078.1 Aspartic proteinase yapsin-3 [Wickerhamiella sorbophila]
MLFLSLGVLTQLQTVFAQADSVGGTLAIPIKGKRSASAPLPRLEHLERRADLPELALINQLTFYQATLEIGSQKEQVQFTIDTGSSDLWVMSPDNPLCAQDDEQIQQNNLPNCSAPITFDYSASSSFSKNQSSVYYGQYADGTVAQGFYAQDTVVIGQSTVKNANFAVATNTNVSQPVFGIASVNDEASVSNQDPTTYANIPVQLKEQGFTQAVAYSLWLNDLNALEGSILFGGVDHEKYVGDLQLVPMVTFTSDGQQVNPPILPFVMLHGVSVYNNKNMAATIAECSLPVALDSGTSLAYLPSDIIDAIGQSISATPLNNLGIYGAYCDLSGGLIWNFSGVEIFTPFSQLLYPLVTTSNEPATYKGRPICGLNIMPSESLFLLGDLFLRSAYVVFDYENYQVAIANTNFNSTESDISTISGGVSATSAASYSSTSYVVNVKTTVATSFTSSIQTPSETNGAGATGREDPGITTGNTINGGPQATLNPLSQGSQNSGSAGASGSATRSSSHPGSSSSSSSSKNKNAAPTSSTPSIAALFMFSIWAMF